MKLIEGQVDDVYASDVEELRDEVSRLKSKVVQLQRELVDTQGKLGDANATAAQSRLAGAHLRKQLTPLYRALQDVFGELDEMGAESADTRSDAPNPKVNAVWESWKQRLGDGCAKCIDALLLHGALNTQQLSIATGYHRTTVPAYVHKLNKAGLITKNGGLFALKKL